MAEELFSEAEFFEKDNSPIDETRICYTPVYFSDEELKEFRQLCKAGMKTEYKQTELNRANVSDLLLLVLRKNYGTNSN